MADSRFNLVHEKWIPAVGKGRVSLLDIFSDDSIHDLAGNAIQKIALIKLFIAIAQASCRLKDEEAWKETGVNGLSDRIIDYLQSHESCFYLYGDKPFLQMPVLAEIKEAKVQEIYFGYLPDLASENDSLLRQLQDKSELDDADKAVFITQLMNYAPGGKRTSFIKPLSPGFQTRTKSAKAGPSLGGTNGYLQTCLKGNSIRETVWLNYFTDDDLMELHGGLRLDVRPPWENMPTGEADNRAKELQSSVYAWLVSISRFVLLDDGGIRYTEGLQYPKIKDGYYEPFITIRKEDNVALFADPSKKPWRSFVAMLQAVYDDSSEYSCDILRLFMRRTKENMDVFSVWSGGLRLRANSGDQSVKQDDDYVESEVTLASEFMDSDGYGRLAEAMKKVEGYSAGLQKAIKAYCSLIDDSTDISAKGRKMYWLAAEPLSNGLINACLSDNNTEIELILSSMRKIVIDVYDSLCPHESARQILVWMKNKPMRGGVDLGKKR